MIVKVSTRKILVVGNDVQRLTTYTVVLVEDHQTVTKVTGILEALKALKVQKFDLFITDLKTEKTSGAVNSLICCK